jgi:hypothetical protein
MTLLEPDLWSAIDQWCAAHEGHALLLTTHRLTGERVVTCVACHTSITELGVVIWR